MKTSKEWREFYQKPGAIATCMNLDWLLDGCPKCGCKEWMLVSNDHRAYCENCRKGYPTAYAFTNASLSYLDGNGLHCFMCRGYGARDGEDCDECGGRVTQP